MCKDKNPKCGCPSCKEHSGKNKSAPVQTLVPSGFKRKTNAPTVVIQSGSGYAKKNGTQVADSSEPLPKPHVPIHADEDSSGAFIAGAGFLFLLFLSSHRD